MNKKLNSAQTEKPKPKSIKLWIILMLAPFLILFTTAFAQVAVKFAIGSATPTSCFNQGPTDTFNNTNNIYGSDQVCNRSELTTSTVNKVINVISWVLGMASYVLIILIPIWIIKLVKDIEYNKKLQ